MMITLINSPIVIFLRDPTGASEGTQGVGGFFLVVSYIYKASVEFLVVRDSWMAEVPDSDASNEEGGEAETTMRFHWPKNWGSMSQKDLEGLYDQREPGP